MPIHNPSVSANFLEVNTMAALRNLSATDLVGHIETQGVNTPGDGGAGRWRIDTTPATAYTTNLGTSNTTFLATGHPFQTGDRVLHYDPTTGSKPTGVSNTNYYLIRVDANSFQLATTFANAIAATPVAITFSADGAGRVNYADDVGLTVIPNSNPPDLRIKRMTEGQEINLAWFGLAGDSTAAGSGTDDTNMYQIAVAAARGKALYIPPAKASYRLTSRISVGANTHIRAHPEADIRQDTWLEMLYDCLDAPGCTFDGGYYHYDGVAQVSGPWGNGYRGQNRYATVAAIYSNSSYTTVRNMRISGFFQGITFYPWNTTTGTALNDYALKSMVIDNVEVNGADIGFLGSGFDGLVVRNFYGSIAQWGKVNPLDSNPAPGHLVYLTIGSGPIRSRGVDMNGLYQRGSTAYTLLKFSYIEGGTFDNIYSYDGYGLLTSGQSSGIHIGTMVATADKSDWDVSGEPISMSNDHNDVVIDNVIINKVSGSTGFAVAEFAGSDVVVKNLVINENTNNTTQTTLDSVKVRGSVRVENYTFRNAGTGRQEAAFRFENDAVNSVLRNPDIQNVTRGIYFRPGQTSCVLEDYDPEKIIVDSVTSSTPTVYIPSGQTSLPIIKMRPYRKTINVSASPVQIYAPEQSTAAPNITTTSAITINNPLHAGFPHELRIEVQNNSGGSMGAITWGSAFNLTSTWTNPANGSRILITFVSDGTNYYEASRSSSASAGGSTTSDPFGIPFTVDPRMISSTGSPTANRCYYLRCYGSGIISKIGMWIGTSSGNLAVAVYSNSGSNNSSAPGTRQATSGSVASPGTGYQEIALGSSVTVNQGDWLAVACDNATIALGIVTQSGSIANLVKGVYAWQDTAFPPPSPPSALNVSATGRMFSLVGVP